MALKGTAELHIEFEELRNTTWFQALLVAAWVLLISSAFSLYTLWVANHFLNPPTLLVLPNIVLVLVALVLLRIRFHMGQLTRDNHTPLILLRVVHQYRPLLVLGLALGIVCALIVPLNFFSEMGSDKNYTCQVRSSPFDPQSRAVQSYELNLSCTDLHSSMPPIRVTANLWARFQNGGEVLLETRKGWLGERWVRFRSRVLISP
jgi:hypothetical protein